MSGIVRIFIKTSGNGRVPVYASLNSAGCDLYAAEDMVLWPGETKLMPLDFIIAAPPDTEIQIRPRSGLSLKTSLRIPNSPGTVDSDFKDPVCVILQNTYSFADFPCEAARDPGLLKVLTEQYKEISLVDFIKKRSRASVSPEDGEGDKEGRGEEGGKGPIAAKPKENSVMKSIIYIDSGGNPYGSIFINKGDRIAQMVVGSYKRAEFVIHQDPASIGSNRGGGFGHTDK